MRSPSSTIAAAALLFLAACDHDTAGPANPARGTMSARIAGAAWSAMSITTDHAPPSSLVVTGSNASATLSLIIPIDQGVGEQVVGGPTPMAAGLVIGSQSWLTSRTQGGSGRITLTTVEPGHLVGTFELTVAHEGASPAEQPVTSGRFDVRY